METTTLFLKVFKCSNHEIRAFRCLLETMLEKQKLIMLVEPKKVMAINVQSRDEFNKW